MKKNFKKIILISLISATCLFTGCRGVLFLLGTRSEQYLYSVRKVIKKHHEKWFGSDSSSSRTVAGIVTKPTEEMLNDNMDYLAQNDWIVSVEFFTGNITPELVAKYDILETYDKPFIVFKTNNDVMYVIPGFKDWNAWTDEQAEKEIYYCHCGPLLNSGFRHPDGIYPIYTYYLQPDEETGNFYYYNLLNITNKFPYPVAFRFNSYEITMHHDEDNPYYYYWGVALTGDEKETYRTLEPVTTEEWLEESSDGKIERELFELRLTKAAEMDWWNYEGTSDPVEFYEKLYSYNTENTPELTTDYYEMWKAYEANSTPDCVHIH